MRSHTTSEWEAMWSPFIHRLANGESEERAASPGDGISFEIEELSDSSDDDVDDDFIRGESDGLIRDGARAGVEGNAGPVEVVAGHVNGHNRGDNRGEEGGLVRGDVTPKIPSQ